jgi:hypothetical protein
VADAIDFPRLGFLYGDYPPDSRVPALLNVSAERGIRIEVPFAHGSPNGGEAYASWFAGDSECPSELAFRDHRLDIHLLDVVVTGHAGNLGVGPGTGYLRAAFAVEDLDQSVASYAQVDQMRSDVELLHDFMGWKLSTTDMATEAGRLSEVSLRTVRHPSVAIGEVDGIEVHIDPVWWAGQRDTRRSEILERTWIRTTTNTPRSVSDHASIHERIRDFVAFVCWRPVKFDDSLVQRTDAAALDVAGGEVEPTWRVLHTASLQRHRQEPLGKYSFADTLAPAAMESIGAAGVLAWLSNRDSLTRVTDPLLNLLYMGGTTSEVALMQTSIATEALGYRLALNNGATLAQAKEQAFRSRLEAIVDSSPLPMGEIVDDVSSWLDSTSKAYNGIKHANRPLPEPRIAYLLAQTMCILVRAHVLVELGVEPSVAGLYKKHRQWWSLGPAYERHASDLAQPLPD